MAYVPLPQYWKTVPQRYRLVAQKCKKCGELQFPPRMMCKKCGGMEFEDFKLSGKGEVHTYTVLPGGVAPGEFDEQQRMTGEIVVALVKLDEGPIVVGQLTECDPEEVEIGMRVKATIRELYEQEGVMRHSFKFKSVGDVEKASSE